MSNKSTSKILSSYLCSSQTYQFQEKYLAFLGKTPISTQIEHTLDDLSIERFLISMRLNFEFKFN